MRKILFLVLCVLIAFTSYAQKKETWVWEALQFEVPEGFGFIKYERKSPNHLEAEIDGVNIRLHYLETLYYSPEYKAEVMKEVNSFVPSGKKVLSSKTVTIDELAEEYVVVDLGNGKELIICVFLTGKTVHARLLRIEYDKEKRDEAFTILESFRTAEPTVSF